MKKRLTDGGKYCILEIAIISFGVGILLAFFLSSRALALIEAILIIALGVLLLKSA